MFSQAADSVLDALGEALPLVGTVARARIREVAAREGGEINANEMNLLGDALDVATSDSSLASCKSSLAVLALVELIEALSHRAHGQETLASQRLFRASFLARYGKRPGASPCACEP